MDDEAQRSGEQEAHRRDPTRRRVVPVLVVAALALTALAATVLQPDVRFSGLRWTPRLSRPTPAPLPVASQPAPTGILRTPAPHPSGHGPDLTWLLWVAVVAVAALISLIVWRRLRGRPPALLPPLAETARLSSVDDDASPEEPAEPDAPVLARGFSRAIELLDEARAPGDAVVAAWLGLQDAASESGITRRRAETPTEFTGRVIRRVPEDQPQVDTILQLYLGVRFGGHPVRAEDVAVVRDALTRLAASWDTAASGTAGRS